MEKSTQPIIKRIAFIGNYQPRQCGIATFTTDLCEAIAQEYKDSACIVLPVNDSLYDQVRGSYKSHKGNSHLFHL